METPPPDQFDEAVRGLRAVLTLRETAEILRCHPRTLGRHIAAGKVTAIKTGHDGSSKTLILRSELARYLREMGGAA